MVRKLGPVVLVARLPMRVSMGVAFGGRVCPRRIARKAHIELNTVNIRFVCTRHMELPAGEFEFSEFTLQRASIHTHINHRADEHVAADAAEDVEIKRVHKLRFPWTKLQRNSKDQAPGTFPRARNRWDLGFEI